MFQQVPTAGRRSPQQRAAQQTGAHARAHSTSVANGLHVATTDT